MRIFVRKENNSWRIAILKQLYQFWLNERGPYENISGLSFANGLVPNRSERQQLS